MIPEDLKQQIRDTIVEVCIHYLGTPLRREGVRVKWACPGCGKETFSAFPEMKKAGCWNKTCPLAGFKDAFDIVGHFDELEAFPQKVDRARKILNLTEPRPEKPWKAPGHLRKLPDSPGSITLRDGNPAARDAAEAPERPRPPSARDGSGDAPPETGPSRGAASANGGPRDAGGTCWQTPGEGGPREEGVRSDHSPPRGRDLAVQDGIVTVEEEDGLHTDSGRGVRLTATPMRAHTETRTGLKKPAEAWALHEEPRLDTDEALRDAVYEEVLELCPLHERDIRFWRSRGLYHETIGDGRFASITAKRARYVVRVLKESFGEQTLLRVPGFRKNALGRMIFTLTGDYTLIPYLNEDSRVTTIEGRYTGEPKKGQPKYVSLYRGGNHLYVFPRFTPDRLEAFCEGPIGAIVAAQHGIAVGAIQGFRRYKTAGSTDPLPELAGVDFRGRQIPYIPDVDDPPKPDVIAEAPSAADYLIARQNGEPALLGLPKGKDLDEWLLGMNAPDRRAGFSHLLSQGIRIRDALTSPAGENQTPSADAPPRPQAVAGEPALRNSAAAPETLKAAREDVGEPAGEKDEQQEEPAGSGEHGVPEKPQADSQSGQKPSAMRGQDGTPPSREGLAAATTSIPKDATDGWYSSLERLAEERRRARKENDKGDPAGSPARRSPIRGPQVTLPSAALITITEIVAAIVAFLLVFPTVWIAFGILDHRIPLDYIRYLMTEHRSLGAFGSATLAALAVWSRMSGHRHALGNHLSGKNRSGKKIS